RVDDHAVGVDVGQVAADVHPVQAAVDGVEQVAAAGAPDRHVGVHRVGGRHGEALDRVGGAAGQAGAAVGEAVGPAVQVHEDLALVGAGVNAGQARRDVGGEGQGRHDLLGVGGIDRVTDDVGPGVAAGAGQVDPVGAEQQLVLEGAALEHLVRADG